MRQEKKIVGLDGTHPNITQKIKNFGGGIKWWLVLLGTLWIMGGLFKSTHTLLGAMSAETCSLTFIMIDRTLTIFITEHNATTWDRLSLIDQESVETILQ